MWCHHFRTISAAVFAATVSGLGLLAGSVEPAGAVTFEPLVLWGDTAPGTGGGTFGVNAANGLRLNNAGDVAFRGFFTAPHNFGVYKKESNGDLNLIALEGDVVPGTEGTRYEWPGSVGLSGNGDVAFDTTLVGPGADGLDAGDYSFETGILKKGNGMLGFVARTGDIAPGTGGAIFTVLQGSTLNESGDIAFGSELAGSGVDGSNNYGVFTGSNGALDLVMRKGEVAPGTGGARFGTLLSDVALNDNGDIAFEASLIGSNVDDTNNSGIFKKSKGELSLVAREGDTAPGTDGAMFMNFQESPRLSDSGDVAFRSALGLNDRGVPVADPGIFMESNGTLDLVAREGDLAPGTDGARFTSVWGPLLNGSGDLVFTGRFTGDGIFDGNDIGIFFAHANSDSIELLLRRWDMVGDARITRLPGASALNDHYLLAVALGFDNGDSGVFLAHDLIRPFGTTEPLAPVPIPGSAVLLGTALLFGGGFAARRRRAAADDSPDCIQEARNAAD